MREVEVAGEKFKVRALKRKEVKALKKNGFNLMALKTETADDAMDAVFEVLFNKEQIKKIDNLDQHAAMKIWTEALGETFGSVQEEKN